MLWRLLSPEAPTELTNTSSSHDSNHRRASDPTKTEANVLLYAVDPSVLCLTADTKSR